MNLDLRCPRLSKSRGRVCPISTQFASVYHSSSPSASTAIVLGAGRKEETCELVEVSSAWNVAMTNGMSSTRLLPWNVGSWSHLHLREKEIRMCTSISFFCCGQKNEINIHTICWVLRNWNESTSIPSFGSLMPYKELA
jgi:hypothetical protein